MANESDSDPRFKNCVFVNNDTPNGRGGAVFSIDGCNPVFANCTLAYNDAISAGAVCTSDSYSILTNCICWGHTGSGIAGAAAITYSDIEGRWPGRGNIDADTDFADFCILAEDWLQSEPPSASFWCGQGCDLTNDAFIDFGDLLMLAENWLSGVAP